MNNVVRNYVGEYMTFEYDSSKVVSKFNQVIEITSVPSTVRLVSMFNYDINNPRNSHFPMNNVAQNVVVDWGDTNVFKHETCVVNDMLHNKTGTIISHTYNSIGVYNVSISAAQDLVVVHNSFTMSGEELNNFNRVGIKTTSISGAIKTYQPPSIEFDDTFYSGIIKEKDANPDILSDHSIPSSWNVSVQHLHFDGRSKLIRFENKDISDISYMFAGWCYNNTKIDEVSLASVLKSTILSAIRNADFTQNLVIDGLFARSRGFADVTYGFNIGKLLSEVYPNHGKDSGVTGYRLVCFDTKVNNPNYNLSMFENNLDDWHIDKLPKHDAFVGTFAFMSDVPTVTNFNFGMLLKNKSFILNGFNLDYFMYKSDMFIESYIVSDIESDPECIPVGNTHSMYKAFSYINGISWVGDSDESNILAVIPIISPMSVISSGRRIDINMGSIFQGIRGVVYSTGIKNSRSVFNLVNVEYAPISTESEYKLNLNGAFSSMGFIDINANIFSDIGSISGLQSGGIYSLDFDYSNMFSDCRNILFTGVVGIDCTFDYDVVMGVTVNESINYNGLFSNSNLSGWYDGHSPILFLGNGLDDNTEILNRNTITRSVSIDKICFNSNGHTKTKVLRSITPDETKLLSVCTRDGNYNVIPESVVNGSTFYRMITSAKESFSNTVDYVKNTSARSRGITVVPSYIMNFNMFCDCHDLSGMFMNNTSLEFSHFEMGYVTSNTNYFIFNRCEMFGISDELSYDEDKKNDYVYSGFNEIYNDVEYPSQTQMMLSCKHPYIIEMVGIFSRQMFRISNMSLYSNIFKNRIALDDTLIQVSALDGSTTSLKYNTVNESYDGQSLINGFNVHIDESVKQFVNKTTGIVDINSIDENLTPGFHLFYSGVNTQNLDSPCGMVVTNILHMLSSRLLEDEQFDGYVDGNLNGVILGNDMSITEFRLKNTARMNIVSKNMLPIRIYSNFNTNLLKTVSIIGADVSTLTHNAMNDDMKEALCWVNFNSDYVEILGGDLCYQYYGSYSGKFIKDLVSKISPDIPFTISICYNRETSVGFIPFTNFFNSLYTKEFMNRQMKLTLSYKDVQYNVDILRTGDLKFVSLFEHVKDITLCNPYVIDSDGLMNFEYNIINTPLSKIQTIKNISFSTPDEEVRTKIIMGRLFNPRSPSMTHMVGYDSYIPRALTMSIENFMSSDVPLEIKYIDKNWLRGLSNINSNTYHLTVLKLNDIFRNITTDVLDVEGIFDNTFSGISGLFENSNIIPNDMDNLSSEDIHIKWTAVNTESKFENVLPQPVYLHGHRATRMLLEYVRVHSVGLVNDTSNTTNTDRLTIKDFFHDTGVNENSNYSYIQFENNKRDVIVDEGVKLRGIKYNVPESSIRRLITNSSGGRNTIFLSTQDDTSNSSSDYSDGYYDTVLFTAGSNYSLNENELNGIINDYGKSYGSVVTGFVVNVNCVVTYSCRGIDPITVYLLDGDFVDLTGCELVSLYINNYDITSNIDTRLVNIKFKTRTPGIIISPNYELRRSKEIVKDGNNNLFEMQKLVVSRDPEFNHTDPGLWCVDININCHAVGYTKNEILAAAAYDGPTLATTSTRNFNFIKSSNYLKQNQMKFVFSDDEDDVCVYILSSIPYSISGGGYVKEIYGSLNFDISNYVNVVNDVVDISSFMKQICNTKFIERLDDRFFMYYNKFNNLVYSSNASISFGDFIIRSLDIVVLTPFVNHFYTIRNSFNTNKNMVIHGFIGKPESSKAIDRKFGFINCFNYKVGVRGNRLNKPFRFLNISSIENSFNTLEGSINTFLPSNILESAQVTSLVISDSFRGYTIIDKLRASGINIHILNETFSSTLSVSASIIQKHSDGVIGYLTNNMSNVSDDVLSVSISDISNIFQNISRAADDMMGEGTVISTKKLYVRNTINI